MKEGKGGRGTVALLGETLQPTFLFLSLLLLTTVKERDVKNEAIANFSRVWKLHAYKLPRAMMKCNSCHDYVERMTGTDGGCITALTSVTSESKVTPRPGKT